MAASDGQQTEVVRSLPEEPWVFLEDNGDVGNELLILEQDGGSKGGEKSIQNPGEPLETSQDAAFLSSCRSAWQHVRATNARCLGDRLYVLSGAFFAYYVLIAFGAVALLTEYYSLQVLLTTVKHFRMAVLWAAASSCLVKFLSLSATKASEVKKPETVEVVGTFLIINTTIIMAAGGACLYEVRAGMMALQEARRQEHFVWFADMASMLALWGTMVLAVSLLFCMGNDMCATARAPTLPSTETWDAQQRKRQPWHLPSIATISRCLLNMFCMCSCMALILGALFLLDSDFAEANGIPGRVSPAAGGGV